MTVSFSDGRALCLLLHHYYPSFLPVASIAMETTTASSSSSSTKSKLLTTRNKNIGDSLDEDDDAFGNMTFNVGSNAKKRQPGNSANKGSTYQDLLENEKDNFRLFHQKVGQ